MNRRAFLGGLGGLVSTAALPASSAEIPEDVFRRRGRFERLSLAYQHIHIGLAKPFSILHISDTHLTAAYGREPEEARQWMSRRTRTFGGRQEDALASSLAWAKANVDYVLHTGDLVDWQTEANLDLVRKYCGGIALGTLGNHEYAKFPKLEKGVSQAKRRAQGAAALAAAYPFDLSFHAQTANGVNFVMIDDVFGAVTEEQVRRFDAEAEKGLPIVLCMHVPFVTDEIWRASERFWRGNGRTFTSAAVPEARGDCEVQREDPVTRAFIARLKSERLLKGILAGHLHITVQDRFSPTAVEYVVGGNFMYHGQEVLFT